VGHAFAFDQSWNLLVIPAKLQSSPAKPRMTLWFFAFAAAFTLGNVAV
jgi:hypothetical protein